MIGRLIFFRSSGLAHWAIYRLLNLSTYSVILRVPLVKKKVFSTLLNNKQSVARLDMLGDWREAHGFGTWRWGTSGFDAAVLKHPIWLIRINKRAAARDSDDEVDVEVGRNLLRTPSKRLPPTTSPFTSPHRRLHPRHLHVHRWQVNWERVHRPRFPQEQVHWEPVHRIRIHRYVFIGYDFIEYEIICHKSTDHVEEVE